MSIDINWKGGNQRDLAREKNLKQQKGRAKAASETDTNKGLTLEERRLRDAEALRKKQEDAAKRKAEAAAGGAASSSK